MMQSLIKFVTRKVVMGLMALAVSGAALLSFADRAEALGISVGTPTIVNGVTIDAAASALDGDRAHVVYSTVSATTYSVMYASNTTGGGYTLTFISSGAIANKPRFLNLVINGTDAAPHVFYYDASSTTICHLVGPSADTTVGFVGTGKVTTTGLAAVRDGTRSGVVLAYSSRNADGSTYSLQVASTVFSTIDTAASFTVVAGTSGVAGAANVVGGQIALFLNSTTDLIGVLYFDSYSSALKLAYISGGSAVEATRQVLDTGSSISGIRAQDAGNVTRVVYTDSSLGLKLAAQRRRISNQAWYIQRIDTSGTSGSVIASGTEVHVLYVKSDVLRIAKGENGTFFDSFRENIVNAQRGLASLGGSAGSANILQVPSSAGRVRGHFVTAAGTSLNAINWTTVSGWVRHSHDLAAGAVASVLVSPSISNGGTGIIPASSSDISGGLTDGSGNYTIDIASAAIFTVSASSTNWTFVNASSHNLIIHSTAATSGFTDGNATANFMAISSSVINTLTPSSGSVAASIGGTNVSENATFVIASSNSANILSNGFTASMNARLVPQSAQGSAPTVAMSTSATETGAIPLSGLSTSLAAFAAVTSTQVWSLHSSTDSALPKYFTLVVTTRTPAGQLMRATKTDAFRLSGISIGIASGTSEQTLPGITALTSTSTINTASFATFIMRSSSPYINVWSGQLLRNNLYLTTSTTLPGDANQSYAGDLNLGLIAMSTDTLNGGSQIAFATASIIGADRSKSYYIRISSRPAGDKAQAQFALSPAITISSPAITSVRLQNSPTTDTSATIDSTGTSKLHVEGRGFISGATVAVTVDAVDDATDGLPVSTHTALTYTVNSSTSMDITIVAISSTIYTKSSFYVTFTTALAGATGGTGVEGFKGTTVTARSASTVVTASTIAITRASPTSVANTRSYTINLFGRGLRGGSTVQFFSTDGTTATTPVTVTEAGNLNGQTMLQAAVDFRNVVFGGKTFSVRATSMTFNETVFGSTDTTVITAEVGVVVSSLTISSFVYPTTSTASAPLGVYNSSGNPAIGINGIGLVVGASVQVDTLTGFFVTPLANVNSSGTFATFQSTAFFNATAGSYQVAVGSQIYSGNAGVTGNSSMFQSTTTASINVLASAISAIAAVNNTNFATMEFGSFTITGVGLMDGATVQLVSSDAGSAKIGGGGLAVSPAISSTTINSVSRTTATAVFDLRSATTAGTYTMFMSQPHPATGPSRVLSGSVTIIRNPFVNSVTPTSAVNSAAANLTILGQGLSAGATVQATFTGTVGTTLGDGTNSLSSAAFNTATLTVTSSSGTIATLSFPANKMPGTWTLSVTSHVASGGYSQGLTPAGANGGTISSDFTYTSSGTVTFTVAESSAPNAPTGLTVLSAGVNKVTLRWSAPGDDGSTNSLDSSDKFILYYSSGEDIRGQGCAPCYPLGAPNLDTENLNAGATNYSFANTWAQFLPFGYAGTALGTSAITNAPPFNFSTSSTRGLIVATKTLTLADLTVNGAVPTSIAPGATVQAADVAISAGSKDSKYWFIIRAIDEAGNISPATLVYTTASATILASVAASDTIDPNATTTLSSLDLGGGVAAGGTIPPGALEGADTLSRVADTNPPASAGATVVGPAVDITLGSGKTEFLKAITLTFTLSGAALAQVQAADPNLVKLAFYNGTRWVPIADSSFSGNTCTGRVTHLTKFGVIIVTPVTNLDSAMVYPNPYRPSLAAHAANNPKITFDLLPAGSKIKIFTIAGDLVRDFADVDRNGSEGWDAKNSDGQDVASGVYIALIDGGGSKKTMKVAVQR